MVICIRPIESRIWADYFSFGLEYRLICTKVWDAWGGSEEAVYHTDIPPKSLLHINLWLRIGMGIFTLIWLSFFTLVHTLFIHSNIWLIAYLKKWVYCWSIFAYCSALQCTVLSFVLILFAKVHENDSVLAVRIVSLAVRIVSLAVRIFVFSAVPPDWLVGLLSAL